MMNRLAASGNVVVAIGMAGLFLSVSILLGQTPSGSISGVVKDESGAVIPGATVVVTNVGTGVRRSIASDSAGRYRAPGLDPGMYQVEAQAAGFQTGVRSGIQLTVGREIEIEMLLRLGQVEQVTEVTAEAPLVETVTNTLSGLVDEQTIRELPLNGRSLDYLMALQPGVHWQRTAGHTNTSGGAVGEFFSVGGSRAVSNQFLLDGIEMVGTGTQANVPGGVLGKNMGVDAIQEFTILTANYSAAYGKRNGGVVNMVSRPGTNQLHGSAFEFLRNDNLDARNFFDPNPQPGEFRRNQFGGSLGGPLRRDKTFFFGNYEGLREGLGKTNIAIVPDNNARQGLLPDLTNPGQLINVGVAPSVRQYIPVLFGEPNGRNFGDGTAEHVAAPTAVSRQDFFLARVDHHFSEKDSLFARYSLTDSSLQDPLQDSLFASNSASRQQSLSLEAKRVYPTTMNVARFGFSRAYVRRDDSSIAPVDSSLRFTEGAEGIGRVTFTGGAATTGTALLTKTGSDSIRLFVLNQFEFSDQVFHYRGPHSLQFGLNVQRMQHNDNNGGGAYGDFSFNDLRSFLLGQPAFFSSVFPGGDAHKSYRRIYFAGFVQDDFKVLPNLTLNLGLRYELMTVPVEKFDRISNFHRQPVNGILVLETNPRLGNPYWRGDHNQWAPRVGFAWDPFHNGKTSIRGGFGIFYDQLLSEWRFFTSGNLPFFGKRELANPPFPLGLSGGGGQAPVPTPGGVDFDLDVPAKLQWNFSVQRQLTPSAAFNIAYVGSHSYHLTMVSDHNIPAPEIREGGVKFYPAGAPRRNPALGNSEFVTTNVNAFYQALQMDFTQQLNQGLRTKVSYTYSKNIDEGSTLGASIGSGNPPTAQDPENIRADRGLSAFDARHGVTTNVTYDIPGGGLSGLPGKLIGGWQLGGIFTANSGEPLTVQTGFNRARSQSRDNANRPNLRAGASNNPVLGGPDRYFDPNAFELPPPGFYGNLGRNTLIGPGFFNVDLSVVKIIPVAERLRTEFRAEFFNLLNHTNFAWPSLGVFNTNGTVRGAAGRITATANTSRQIQFGLKLSF